MGGLRIGGPRIPYMPRVRLTSEAWTRCCGMVALVLAHSSRAAAQDSTGTFAVSPQAAADVAADTTPLPDEREAIVRDSIAGMTWMDPIHQEWSRYDAPSMCLAALEQTDYFAWRRFDFAITDVPGSQQDSVSTNARNVGLVCASRFTVASVPIDQLHDFRDLALLLNDITLAKSINARILANAPTPYARLRVIHDAAWAYVHTAKPPRFAEAESLLAQMRSGTRAEQLWSIFIWNDIDQNAMKLDFDTTAILRRADTEYQHFTSTRFTPEEIQAQAYGPLFASMRAVEAFVPVDIYRKLPKDTVRERNYERYRALWANEVHDSTVLPLIGPEAYRKRIISAVVDSFDLPVPPFHPDYWFLPGDTVPRQEITVPTPGKVTLFLPVRLGLSRAEDGNEVEIGIYRRLYGKYANDGLEIVLVADIQGYAFASGPLEPLDEAKAAAWFFHGWMKLPFPVAVFDREKSTLPDGRITRGLSKFEATKYSYGMVGRDGRRYPATVGVAGTLSFLSESLLEAVVRQALGLPEK